MTSNRFSLALTTLIVAGTFSTASGAEPAKSRKPNVIVILADDLGYECLGCNGGTSYKTPVLDRLTSGGMRFDHCYAQPLCTPSRVQMMTGIYNVRNYVRFGLLEKNQTTFAQLFRQAGYATGIAGKWQLGHGFDLPAHFGFDSYCLWQLNRRPPRYANAGLEIDGKTVDYTKGEYGPDIVSDYALDFVTKKKDKPFFLYYPMMLTHDPFQPTPDSADWDPKAKGEGVNRNNKHFGEMVSYMDKLVGKLIDHVDKLGLRDNTLIIFTGDNGTSVAITSKMGDRVVKGGKGSTRDAGTHVPLIANWPGVVPAGKVSNDLVDFTDFLPTICEAAGIAVPEKLAIDGHSFFPQLKGDKGMPREWVYCWYSENGAGPGKEFARTQRFKRYRNGELFDIRADPLEKQALPLDRLSAEASAAYKLLEQPLEKYKEARAKRKK
jgi:arylsulfatase A